VKNADISKELGAQKMNQIQERPVAAQNDMSRERVSNAKGQ